MKSSFVVFLLLCGMAACQIREYVYIAKNLTWSRAQNYCREKYIDLATITTEEENQSIMNTVAALNIKHIWIGLNRSGPELDVWQWSDGEMAHFFKWKAGQPDNNNKVENCVMVSSQGWIDVTCSVIYSFFCSVRFVLVKENKTWAEARDYCRIHYTGLATPMFQHQLTLAENATAQTVSVWTGLHFVNGQWICVGKQSLGSLISLSSCPDPRYRCGARNTEKHIWENRYCDEKLNFLCY